MNKRTLLVMGALVVSVFVVGEVNEAWARAGGGGSRGSRSYSAPRAPSAPSSPQRSVTQPASPVAPAAAAPGRGLMGGLMGGLAGFAIGGLLGGLLFGGLGHGGLGGLGGIGLFDMLLIGGGILMLVMFLRRRRQTTPAPAYAGAGTSANYGATNYSGGSAATTVEMPAGLSDLDRGVQHIQSMDPRFDPEDLLERGRFIFAAVQKAIVMRDVTPATEWLTPEMFSTLQQQCSDLRSKRRTNMIDDIQIGESSLSEAWQETGQDFVTIHVKGTMIDYTLDDGTQAVVEGSKTDRSAFAEFWTFTRPVGPNRWKLSSIING
jgi:predicted lipid-binding transport protein (Tim44 family)